MEFKNTLNENIKRSPKKATVKIKEKSGQPYQVGNVLVYLRRNDLEDIPEEILPATIEEVIRAQEMYPGIVQYVDPPLSSIFTDKELNLLPGVAVGDLVTYKKSVYLPDISAEKEMTAEDRLKVVHTVIAVELSSISSMSVFTANLDNGDKLILTNFLKKV